MDENDLPTASLQLELKKSRQWHTNVWITLFMTRIPSYSFVSSMFSLFFSFGHLWYHSMFSLAVERSSDGRAAKHIHTKSPWCFPSILIVPFISTDYDVRKSVCIYFHMCRIDDMYGSKRMAYILPKLHRIQASTWFSASPFFQNVEVDSASLFLAGFIILMDLLGLLVAVFYLRLWGNTRAKMGQQVEVQSWWCLMRGMGQGPLLGRQYTVGIVGRVLLVPYHTKNVDLTTWSNFRSQNMSSVMDFKDEFLFFHINEGVGLLILLFGYKISQDAKKCTWICSTKRPTYTSVNLTWEKPGWSLRLSNPQGGKQVVNLVLANPFERVQ